MAMLPQRALGGDRRDRCDRRARRPAASRLGRAAALVALSVAALVSAGCSRRPPDGTPDGAVRELVARLRQLHGDPADAKAVFELLSRRARDNLASRAQRYSAATGKAIAPEAMITPSRFLLRFEPQRYAAQISGAHALVEVAGLLPGERVQVPCVYEDAGWRVELALPALPPVQKRPGSDL
ncbi:hypothetical protein SOCE26_022150 [Sorangium cellulosum]|uniref:Uncharacterized protein n=1 Tax=Sorangium cellulosum TaxID=56 RepID=A0A2L0ENC8_SORCE|nr:hypothetical protein [Sorangium cellulosum]AUX40814.1 hypothetical protein SOCE26_022150 [Sorangium cellulosum]